MRPDGNRKQHTLWSGHKQIHARQNHNRDRLQCRGLLYCVSLSLFYFLLFYSLWIYCLLQIHARQSNNRDRMQCRCVLYCVSIVYLFYFLILHLLLDLLSSTRFVSKSNCFYGVYSTADADLYNIDLRHENKQMKSTEYNRYSIEQPLIPNSRIKPEK